ncbi:Lrp/AsnC family transcriptional regulator [Thermoanaerobacter thermohydrosulfuricus]|jgi:Lrp/AsnC family transcriptional regulator for asnA, asnC and gidA|uniref:Transcriptional regulator n=1 Tax=Thermoanaerobacter thermohydrosulfuricus WC1 TaxID=1198630 RepID=M8DGS4_THETY|nr:MULTISPECIES: Lrp/AsnC family transcriptional regulator [Thermoanaerobacter]EMT39242.1 Transcriptional regulator [Thermoanaerobacter thermohydrosulfuricus WC1]KUJ89827.1 MAG: AsnC family transcriptional regulator [Thermoanaerobacter thermocopriae]MDI3529797.1 Lrp/AsnC family transcriptional regulator, regulator for asnA, asnC and gidA [Thermoanaerobacter sp.]SFE19643.1 Lrp/AsnC family transcriptional regulator, regulator for asnA, asnC and gidA [Thermoanaerobacter thermohydrosulfuricus]
MKFDELDFEIMRILQTDGRKSFREIAALLKKPESTVRLRYNQLVANNILRVVAIPDPKQVGFEVMAILCLKVDLVYLQEVAEALAKVKEVRFIAYTAGRYDLIVEIYMKSNDDLIKFMTEDLAKMKGIKECDLSIELKLFKDTYNWMNEV